MQLCLSCFRRISSELPRLINAKRTKQRQHISERPLDSESFCVIFAANVLQAMLTRSIITLERNKKESFIAAKTAEIVRQNERRRKAPWHYGTRGGDKTHDWVH